MYEVLVKKKAVKRIKKSPPQIQELFDELVEDLKTKGPIQENWTNYSKLSENTFHCHLSYSYIACWTSENNSIKIEVYYAGSREDAPY